MTDDATSSGRAGSGERREERGPDHGERGPHDLGRGEAPDEASDTAVEADCCSDGEDEMGDTTEESETCCDTTEESETCGTAGCTEDADNDATETASEDGTRNGEQVQFSVPDMDCPSCATKVENALTDAGVEGFETRPTTGTVVADVGDAADPDQRRTTAERIAAAIESAGYDVDGTSLDGDETGVSAERAEVWRSPRALKTYAAAGFTLGGIAVGNPLTTPRGPLLALGDLPLLGDLGAAVGFTGSVAAADLLYLGAVLLAGVAVFRNGFYSLRNRSLDIDLLMSIAITGAIAASLVFAEALIFEAAMLTVLFSVSELLEQYSLDRARDSLRELMNLSPEEATVRRDGEEVTVPADEVAVGETVIVRPGEKIPRDGFVSDGTSAVNQAPVTGESVPVDKTAGDEVYAGTINTEGYLEVEVTSESGEDTLSQIVDLVEAAQSETTEREQFVERFAGYYTPVVVTAGVALGVLPPLLFDAPWAEYVVYGLTLFVLACPCAFVISTPVTVVSGLTSAARHGVLIKGGRHLEAVGDVDAIAFDKTGTLTRGELAVTDVIPLGDRTEEDVLQCARGVERRSEHPIGDAIVAHAEDDLSGEALSAPEISEFESITGAGVTAELGGETHYAGKPGLFEDLGFDLSHVHAATDGGVVTRTSQQLCERHNCLDLLEETVPELQAEGKTVVLVGTEEVLEGVIAVADEIRPEAKRTVAALRERGIETVMLTGDNERTAAAVGAEIGIDDVRAELLPDEKVTAVQELLDEYETVAMLGDGINDAPALATATVGIAMGAAGTDTALETADVALLSDDLSKLPYLTDLARTGTNVIRQNVWTSLAAKATLAVAVPFGYVPIWAAVLLGDAGMTVGVTGNAMRLAGIEPDEN
jgi:Cd2+/Zn2+-exporting ATPase